MTVRVAVVGGGLSGLLTAVALVDAGVDDVVVLERSTAPGGVAGTVRRDGYLFEPAVGSVTLPHPHLSPLLARIRAEMVPATEAAVTRLVFTGEDLVEVPSSPKALLAPVMPLRSRLRLLVEPLVRNAGSDDDESVESFLRRRFGADAGSRLAWLAVSGVFAGDPGRLSVRSSFPGLACLVDEAGSILVGGLRRMRNRSRRAARPVVHVPAAGMGDLAATAAAWLGGRYRTGSSVTCVRRKGAVWRLEGDETTTADHVVLACRPEQAADLVGGNLGGLLAQAVSAPVAVVGLGGPEVSVPSRRAFGVLPDRASGLTTRGVLFESSYAPGRAPEGHSLLKAIVGGATRTDPTLWDDATLVERVTGEVARILGRDLQASFVEVARHTPGIPQYEIGHARWLAEIDRVTPSGLTLTGWGYRGVGVANLAIDAVRIASSISGVGSS